MKLTAYKQTAIYQSKDLNELSKVNGVKDLIENKDLNDNDIKIKNKLKTQAEDILYKTNGTFIRISSGTACKLLKQNNLENAIDKAIKEKINLKKEQLKTNKIQLTDDEVQEIRKKVTADFVDSKFPNLKNIDLSIDTVTKQTLDIILLEYTRTKNLEIKIPMADFLALRGVKNNTKTRERIQKDLIVLGSTSLSFLDDFNDLTTISLFQMTKYQKNYGIKAILSSTFITYLESKTIMDYDVSLCAINPKLNPYSYIIGRKLYEYNYINKGKKNQNTISVKSLIKLLAIPTLDELKEKSKKVRITQQIIRPFIRDLDKLKQLKIIDYHFIGLDINKLNYNDFINAQINFKIINTNYNQKPYERYKNNKIN